MSFLNRLRLLPVASLLFTVAASQVCYFPDGLTVSSDVPCNSNAAASSCCPSDSFCMDNGLCFGGGVVSRASCTDQAWDSSECAQYCTEIDRSSSVSLTPCDADAELFTCGLNTTHCQTNQSTFVMSGGNALVLRPDQVASLTQETSSDDKDVMYTSGNMIGVALGIGLPLLFSLILALLVLRKERQKSALKTFCDQQSAPAIHISGYESRPSFSTISRSGTMTTIESTYKPQQPATFMEKYGHHKGYYAQDGDLSVPVFELPTNSPGDKDDRVEAP